MHHLSHEVEVQFSFRHICIFIRYRVEPDNRPLQRGALKRLVITAAARTEKGWWTVGRRTINRLVLWWISLFPFLLVFLFRSSCLSRPSNEREHNVCIINCRWPFLLYQHQRVLDFWLGSFTFISVGAGSKHNHFACSRSADAGVR